MSDNTAGPLEVRLSDQLGLSAEVQELLREWDMYAEPAYTGSTDLLLVRDEEGTALFKMTPQISALDLRLMHAYAWTMHQKGLKDGQKIARNTMRSALGLRLEA